MGGVARRRGAEMARGWAGRWCLAAALVGGAAMWGAAGAARPAAGGSPFPEATKSGFAPVKGTKDGHLFWWSFEARHDADGAAPLIVWLNGGPGCSSEMGALYENGPFGPRGASGDLQENPFSWSEVGHLLYVDQPVGTGFSYTSESSDLARSEQQVSDDFWEFLQYFFAQHPELGARDLYIAGESYAGHYVPAIGYRIVQGNSALAPGENFVNLKGIAVGNGLVNPRVQYQAYSDYALANNMIGAQEYRDLKARAEPACVKGIDECEAGTETECEQAVDTCNNEILGPIIEAYQQQIGGQMNPYDISKLCGDNPLCYDFSAMEKLLERKDVKSYLGVTGHDWEECSEPVHAALMGDWMKNLEVHIPQTLAAGVKVMVYAGDLDFICNWEGNHQWTEEMEWSGQQAFNSASFQDFPLVGGQAAGQRKSSGGLSFVRIYKAGHMVPMDQPEAALKMLQSWVGGN